MVRATLLICLLVLSQNAFAGSIAAEYNQRGQDARYAERQRQNDVMMNAVPLNAEREANSKVVGLPEIERGEGRFVYYYYRMRNQLRCRVPVSIDTEGFATFTFEARCQ